MCIVVVMQIAHSSCKKTHLHSKFVPNVCGSLWRLLREDLLTAVILFLLGCRGIGNGTFLRLLAVPHLHKEFQDGGHACGDNRWLTPCGVTY